MSRRGTYFGGKLAERRNVIENPEASTVCSGDQVAIYSRQCNDVSAAIPEIVEQVRALPARDLILDGEVLSFTADGRPQQGLQNNGQHVGMFVCVEV